jgi:hypothetical protein
MRNISGTVAEKIKTRILYSICIFRKCAVYETMWKNMVEPDRPQISIKYGAEKMRFACRITKARRQTHAHNIQYLLLLTAGRNIL